MWYIIYWTLDVMTAFLGDGRPDWSSKICSFLGRMISLIGVVIAIAYTAPFQLPVFSNLWPGRIICVVDEGLKVGSSVIDSTKVYFVYFHAAFSIFSNSSFCTHAGHTYTSLHGSSYTNSVLVMTLVLRIASIKIIPRKVIDSFKHWNIVQGQKIFERWRNGARNLAK